MLYLPEIRYADSAVAIIEVQDSPHVFTSLGVRGNTSVSFYRIDSGVISRETKLHVTAVPAKQKPQMSHAALYVIQGILCIRNIVLPSRIRHQLHQSHRSFRRARIRIEIRFRFYHRPNQIGVDAMAIGCRYDDIIK